MVAASPHTPRPCQGTAGRRRPTDAMALYDARRDDAGTRGLADSRRRRGGGSPARPRKPRPGRIPDKFSAFGLTTAICSPGRVKAPWCWRRPGAGGGARHAGRDCDCAWDAARAPRRARHRHLGHGAGRAAGRDGSPGAGRELPSGAEHGGADAHVWGGNRRVRR
jgi:hypothetical protein